jgi:pimeloyl-ACP methyl ester carboxylesterase
MKTTSNKMTNSFSRNPGKFLKRLPGRFFCVMLILGAIAPATNAQSLVWEGIEYGPHQVGYELFNAPDYSRTYTKMNESGLGPRPMVIGLWFPAQQEVLSPEEFKELYQIAWASTEGLSEDNEARIEQLINDQQVSDGQFPLVLYSPGRMSSGYGNIALCELLASHGYVVATVASKGFNAREIFFNEQGVEAQSRDLEYLFGLMSVRPEVDATNPAVVGYSLGGLTMHAFALKNQTVSTMVSFDSSLRRGTDLLQRIPTIDLGQLEVSLLAFMGEEFTLEDYKYADTSPFTNHFAMLTKGLDHLDFGSAPILNRNKPAEIQTAYASMANRTRRFLDVGVKGAEWSDEIIALDGEWFVDRLVQESSKQLQVPAEEFLSFLEDQGADAAVQVYFDTKRDFPDYQLFEFDAVAEAAEGMPDTEALKLYWMLLDAFPNEAVAYELLAKALIDAGEAIQAKAVVMRGLQVFPEDRNLKVLMEKAE